MARKVLTLAVLICFLIGIANLMANSAEDDKSDPKSFKKASKADNKLKKSILKSRAYKQVYNEIKAMGKKGPAAARKRLRVYPKQAVASEITINEQSRQGPHIPRQIEVAAISVYSGGELQGQPTPIGIIMVGTGDGKYQAIRVTAEIGKDGKPMSSLVGTEGKVKGKSVYDSPIDILSKSHLKVKKNGTAISTNGNEVLVLIKRNGETYALVIPAEVFVELLGRLGSGSGEEGP
jgi:hypothetical protein